jgi:hypothetical protein
MAQDLQIGRAGLAAASGGDDLILRLMSDSGWEQEGDRATVRGVIRGRDFSTIADMKAARDQIQGYGPDNTDEPVIPVTSAQDSSRDGFYRVLRTSVDGEVTGRPLSTAEVHALAWPFRVELLRVPGWQAPLFEMISRGAARGGGGVASGDPWLAWPYDGTPSYRVGDWTGLQILDEQTSAGKVAVTATGSGLDYFYNGWLTFYCDPGKYFYGNCGVEYTTDGGTTWRTVVGRQIPNDPDGWRLTNRRTRISVSNNAAGTLQIGYYDGSQWETNDFVVSTSSASGGAPGGTATNYDTVTILRNSPEAASVLLTSGFVNVTLSIRRGGTLIEGHVNDPRGTFALGIWRTASEAGTSITGGIEATTAVAGNKYVLLSPDAINKDVTGQSGIELTAVGSDFHFAAGVNNSAILSGQITIQEQYFAANNSRQHVAAR